MRQVHNLSLHAKLNHEDAMESWNTAVKRALVSGSSASLLSTAALAALGKAETGSMSAPTNAISHWIWGGKAARKNAPSMRYTLVGYAIHHASATFWALLFEKVMGEQMDKKNPALTLTAATAASAVACFVDYQMTPQRLRPGYEKRLSRPALAVVYGAFGVGLALGAMAIRRD
jgi:hypothetical protein